VCGDVAISVFTGQIVDMDVNQVAAVMKLFVREKFSPQLAEEFAYPSARDGRDVLLTKKLFDVRIHWSYAFSESSIPLHPHFDEVCTKFLSG
jgi:hypothetical protein